MYISQLHAYESRIPIWILMYTQIHEEVLFVTFLSRLVLFIGFIFFPGGGLNFAFVFLLKIG